MVHQVGRKHASKLRVIAIAVGAAIPLFICLLVHLSALPPIALGIAFIAFLAGLFVERWLFFAEAKHAVSLYY